MNFKRGFSRQKYLIYTEGAAEQIHFLAQQVFNYFPSITKAYVREKGTVSEAQ